jgi:CRISPR-associated endonuclease Cas2
MPKFYKGYRIGSIEKQILKMFLGVASIEFNRDKYWEDEKWIDIFKLVTQKRELPVAVDRLNKKDLLKLVHKNGKISLLLTKKGKTYLKENFFNISNVKVGNKIWDGKWYIVIFDIPEVRRKIRNILRFHLKKIGFVQVQGSVWAYPYPSNEIVTLIKTNFELSSEVVYIIADYIEGENKLMKIFNISREK